MLAAEFLPDYCPPIFLIAEFLGLTCCTLARPPKFRIIVRRRYVYELRRLSTFCSLARASRASTTKSIMIILRRVYNGLLLFKHGPTIWQLLVRCSNIHEGTHIAQICFSCFVLFFSFVIYFILIFLFKIWYCNIYIYIYIHIYTCICIYVYIYMYIYIYICICIYIYIYSVMYVHIVCAVRMVQYNARTLTCDSSLIR